MAKKKQPAAKKPPTEEKRIYTTNLKCELSAKEVREAADDLARNLDDLESIEADKKDVVEQFKAKTAAAEAEVIRLKNLVRNKYEFRDVKCEEVKNHKKSKCTVTRLDTKEVITDRPLRDDEKQRKMELSGEAGPPANSAQTVADSHK
jgi:hypothetical protein